jgi:hypothetical protein
MKCSPSSIASKAPKTTPSISSSISSTTIPVFTLSLPLNLLHIHSQFFISYSAVCLFVIVKSSIIDREPVHRVVTLLLEAEAASNAFDDEGPGPSSDSSSSAIRVIDSFLIPKLHYDPIKKIFHEYVTRLPIFFFFFFFKFYYNALWELISLPIVFQTIINKNDTFILVFPSVKKFVLIF